MVGVLAAAPVVDGRARIVPEAARVLGAHLAGLLATALPIGALFGAAGALLMALLGPATPAAPLAAAIFGAVVLAYGAHDLRLIRLPHPQRESQVPNRWRRKHDRLAVAFGYGLGLGPGFLVFVRSGGYFAMLLGVVLSGSVAVGMAAFVAMALGRFSFLSAARAYRTSERSSPLLFLMARVDGEVRLFTGSALAAIGTSVLMHVGGAGMGVW